MDIEEIQEVVKNNHNATVEFTLIAKADQYRESIGLARQEAEGIVI